MACSTIRSISLFVFFILFLVVLPILLESLFDLIRNGAHHITYLGFFFTFNFCVFFVGFLFNRGFFSVLLFNLFGLLLVSDIDRFLSFSFSFSCGSFFLFLDLLGLGLGLCGGSLFFFLDTLGFSGSSGFFCFLCFSFS